MERPQTIRLVAGLLALMLLSAACAKKDSESPSQSPEEVPAAQEVEAQTPEAEPASKCTWENGCPKPCYRGPSTCQGKYCSQDISCQEPGYSPRRSQRPRTPMPPLSAPPIPPSTEE